MKTSVITAAMALALSLPVQAASNELNYNLGDFNETASVREQRGNPPPECRAGTRQSRAATV